MNVYDAQCRFEVAQKDFRSRRCCVCMRDVPCIRVIAVTVAESCKHVIYVMLYPLILLWTTSLPLLLGNLLRSHCADQSCPLRRL